MKKKVLLFVFCLLLVFSTPVWASGFRETSGGEITPYMTFIRSSDVGLRIKKPYGYARIDCSLEGNSGVTFVEIYAELQQYRNGRWQTVDTFSERKSSSEVYLDESCRVSEGFAYRVRATLRAYRGSSSERKIIFSNTVMY